MADVSSLFRKPSCSVVPTFFSLHPLFHDHTPFSPLPALTFICLTSSALHFLIPLLSAISPLAAATPPVPAQAPATPLTYLHSLLLFIFPLSWTFSSLFPQVQPVAYKAVALSLTWFSISISILQVSLGITCIMFCFFQL